MNSSGRPDQLPSVAAWYRVQKLDDRITQIVEPHVHEFLRSNIWHIKGRERDLVVDAGLGVTSLKRAAPAIFAHDPVLVISHAHLDHVGSAHEFTDRRGLPVSAPEAAIPASLRGPELARLLGLDVPDMPELLVDAVPRPGYDIDEFDIPPFTLTGVLGEGDVIDLGDQRWTVLTLPGHTPESLGLFNAATGELMSGDVIYDDLLLDELPESNIADYIRSLRRLDSLPVTVVYPGHGDPFDAHRMREIIQAYLDHRAPETIRS